VQTVDESHEALLLPGLRVCSGGVTVRHDLNQIHEDETSKFSDLFRWRST
jgi:hypothetical protein